MILRALCTMNGVLYAGNKETLWDSPIRNSINVLERLKAFHGQYYSANIMSLVVFGTDSLDELAKQILELFSQVPNWNIPMPMWPDNPYGPKECGVRIDMSPVADVKDLYICFPIPDTRPFYKTFVSQTHNLTNLIWSDHCWLVIYTNSLQPHGYLTNLLAHKGKGSLFSFLNRKNWINNHFMSSSVPARGFGILSIGLQLTDLGLDSIDDIIDCVFQVISLFSNLRSRLDQYKSLNRHSY
jgi:insulysin